MLVLYNMEPSNPVTAPPGKAGEPLTMQTIHWGEGAFIHLPIETPSWS